MSWVDEPVWPGNAGLRAAVKMWQGVLAHPGSAWPDVFEAVPGMERAARRARGGCTPAEAVSGSEYFVQAVVSNSSTVPLEVSAARSVTTMMLATLRAQLGMAAAASVAALASVVAFVTGHWVSGAWTVLAAAALGGLAVASRRQVRGGEVALVLLCANPRHPRAVLGAVAKLDNSVQVAVQAYEAGAGLSEATAGAGEDVQRWAAAVPSGAGWNAAGAEAGLSKVMLWMGTLGPAVIGVASAAYILSW